MASLGFCLSFLLNLPDDILEWASARGTRFYNLEVTGDEVNERGLRATVSAEWVCLPLINAGVRVVCLRAARRSG